jgi:hypothetical protein
MTGSGVCALAFRVIAGLVRPTFRRRAGAGFAGADLEASASVFFAIFASAGFVLTAAGAGGADFNFVTGLAVAETGFDFSVGVGGVFLDLPIFIGGPRDLRLQRPETIRPLKTRPTKTQSGRLRKVRDVAFSQERKSGRLVEP